MSFPALTSSVNERVPRYPKQFETFKMYRKIFLGLQNTENFCVFGNLLKLMGKNVQVPSDCYEKLSKCMCQKHIHTLMER